MIQIFNSYLVEINFPTAPTAGQTVNFLDVPQLRDKLVYAVELVTASQMVTSPTGKVIASQANALTGSLTILNTESYQVFQQVPNGNLITQLNAGIIKEFAPTKIDLQKSNVQIFSAGIGANESLCYNFIYLKPEQLKEYLASRR
mgnify:CR=1 FL=1